MADDMKGVGAAATAMTRLGPFELSEYRGLVIIYVALAITAPFLPVRRPLRRAG